MNFRPSVSVVALALAATCVPLLAQDVSGQVSAPTSPQVVNRIAATVNGRPITSNEVRIRMTPYVRELMMANPNQGAGMTDLLLKAKKAVIDELVERELVLSEFDTKGYMIPEQQISEELNDRILKRFNGKRADFLEMLRKMGMSYSEYKESISKELSVGAMRSQRYERGIPPTPDEMREEYNRSKRDLRDVTMDKVVFEKIYIPFVPDASAGDVSTQYASAVTLAKQIKSGDISFADAAKKYSTDAHAKDGGKWPATKRIDMAADFANVLFSAKVGGVVGPLYDPAGFTIVRLKQLIDAPIPSFDEPEVKKLIDAAVRRRMSEKRYRAWVDRLKEQAVIRIYV